MTGRGARLVMRGGATGRVRRMVVGLLVLALLALSAAPVLAAPPSGHDRHAATRDCSQPDSIAVLAAAPSPDRDHRSTVPALACCLASQCPMLLGGLPVPPIQCMPCAGPIILLAVPARGRVGIDVPPALPPPRAT